MKTSKTIDKLIDHKLYPIVFEVLQLLESKGFEAYLAGGAVRDLLLGRQVADFDIATNALPEEVKAIFGTTISHAEFFGTITVLHKEKSFEVTTYRSEFVYSKNRSPSKVDFSKSYIQDSERRDFRMNGLYCDKKGVLFDPQEGLLDIENKVIQSIGEAKERFKEDALRMYRALRFAAQLDFIITDKVQEALLSKWYLTKKLSRERRYQELKKTICAPYFFKQLDFILKNKILESLAQTDVKFSKEAEYLKERLQNYSDHKEVFTLFLIDLILLQKPNKRKKYVLELIAQLSLRKGEIKTLQETVSLFYNLESKTAESIYIQLQVFFGSIESMGFISQSLLKKIKMPDVKIHRYFDYVNRNKNFPEKILKAKDFMDLGVQTGPGLGEVIQKAFEYQILTSEKNKAQLVSWAKEELIEKNFKKINSKN